MSINGRIKSAAFVLAVLACGVDRAGAETITFDELTTRPLDGVSLKGVTFGFAINGVASSDAAFNTIIGPGGVPPFISPPNAEGNSAGVLSFFFAQASSDIRFGLARNVPIGTSGASVELFSGNTSLGLSSVIVAIPGGGIFPEGLFTSTATNVTRGTITFINPATAPRFALDNFGFTPGVAAIPEPSSVALCGIAALVGLGYTRSRRVPATV